MGTDTPARLRDSLAVLAHLGSWVAHWHLCGCLQLEEKTRALAQLVRRGLSKVL